MPDPAFLTVEETADLLRSSKSSIYSSKYRNEPPGNLGMKAGRKLLFDPDEVMNWLRDQRSDSGQRIASGGDAA